MGKVYTRFQTKTAQKPYPPQALSSSPSALLLHTKLLHTKFSTD